MKEKFPSQNIDNRLALILKKYAIQTFCQNYQAGQLPPEFENFGDFNDNNIAGHLYSVVFHGADYEHQIVYDVYEKVKKMFGRKVPVPIMVFKTYQYLRWALMPKDKGRDSWFRDCLNVRDYVNGTGYKLMDYVIEEEKIRRKIGESSNWDYYPDYLKIDILALYNRYGDSMKIGDLVLDLNKMDFIIPCKYSYNKEYDYSDYIEINGEKIYKIIQPSNKGELDGLEALRAINFNISRDVDKEGD